MEVFLQFLNGLGELRNLEFCLFVQKLVLLCCVGLKVQPTEYGTSPKKPTFIVGPGGSCYKDQVGYPGSRQSRLHSAT